MVSLDRVLPRLVPLHLLENMCAINALPRILTEDPYRRVGKIFWLKHDTRDIIYHTTGFYIDYQTIMTVAHTFDEEAILKKGTDEEVKIPIPLNAAIFVPAMSDREDIYGKNYGHYRIVKTYIHNKYNKNKLKFSSKFDIGIATIELKPYGKTEENPTGFHMLPDIDQYLPVRPYPDSHPDSIKVVGYGSTTTGRMMEFKVTSDGLPLEFRDFRYDIVMKKPAVLKGTSGGPWLYCNIAIGIQSGVSEVEKENISCSPYITQNLLDDWIRPVMIGLGQL